MPQNTLLTFIMLMMATMMLLSSMVFLPKVKNFKKPLKKSNKMKFLTSSIFISFDPKTSFTILGEMNWMICLLFTIPILSYIWAKPNKESILFFKLTFYIKEQMEIALKSKKDSSSLLFSTIFLFILSCNLIGLIPNLFTSSSHLTMNLMISVPLWMSFMIFGWTSYTNKMFQHLVPMGTPTILISFMVLIELVSTIIRPLTLSIRLMANMVSGHLLLTLLGNTMENLSVSMNVVMISLQSALSILEISVGFIQAYVFCMLLTLYSDESDYSK